MAPLYRERTPVEQYSVDGVLIFVKREDLFGRAPAPPLGKLRGLPALLRKIEARKALLVGCWDTRVSRLGEGLAAACSSEFRRLRALVSYPTRIGASLPPSIAAARRLGAEILPLRGNHVSICYAQARKHVESMGGVMLPFGLDCEEAVHGVATEAARVPMDIAHGTVILCAGSGVTLAGLLTGLPVSPKRVIALSSGRSVAKIRACVGRHIGRIPSYVEILPARMPYESTPSIGCPFPTHPNYDLKAWQYVTERARSFAPPILFWNIGA